MSIFFDFHVGPSGRRFRRAVHGDICDIELIQDKENTEKLFGTVNIGSLIELSTLAICMIDWHKEVIGFMALNDYPNVSGVDPGDWETWIRNMFQRYYLSRNTLFIHFMCCKESVLQFFLNETLVSVFQNDSYLLQIVLVVSSTCSQEILARYNIFKRRNMSKYFAKREDECELQYIYAALRQDHCPKLKIRRAVEEDNDDICDILHKTCPRLKELYGEYYISEILGRHPESKRKVIVAECHDRAVGVMCLNPDINYRKLQSIYELRPFYGLKKATPLEKEQMKRSNVLLNTFGDPIMLGKWSPFDSPPDLDEIVNNAPSRENSTKGDLGTGKSKVYFKGKVVNHFQRRRSSSCTEEIDVPKIDHNVSDDMIDNYFQSQDVSLSSVLSASLLLEDDPFDYDIVNIDVSLLTAAMDEFIMDVGSSHQPSQQSRPSETPSTVKKRRITKTHDKDSDMYIYSGQPNAFMIELFGLHEDIDGRSAFDLLEVAFEMMKDYDYCIIRVPSADKSFPLLQHFCLVPNKPRMCCVYSLYIAHRASVLGYVPNVLSFLSPCYVVRSDIRKLRVREAEFIDIPLIATLFHNLQGKETIWTIENCILQKETHQAYVFMSGLSVVGIGILEPPEKLNFLRSKFNMERFHNHKYHRPAPGSTIGFSAVDVALVYSVFEPHFRFFAREMMRFSGCSSLVWMTAYKNKWVAHKANSLVSTMVALLPRKSDITFAEVPELLTISQIDKNLMAFSTWFLNRKLTSVPMVNVTTKIVLLGASRTAMAFLNTLLFGDSSTYLTFTNITLISANGLPYIRHSNRSVEMMFPRYHNNTDKYLKSVPYTYYVNVVHGTMAEINKADKYITLTNGSRYSYDLLFLLFGKQYQHPDYLKPLPIKHVECKSYVRLDIPRATFEPEVINYNTPLNVFIINNISQADKALKFVNNCLTENIESKIVVYGATINTYSCLAALLDMNVPPKNIVFIEPFPPENADKIRIPVFYNSNVDKTICKVIENLKIKTYRSYYFQSWNTVDNFVTHVNFLSHFQMVTLQCAVFFYYGKRGVNTEAFFAINKAGMAYDAGILIDHEFRTKDPYIYAAGPATAYYRKYFASTMKQKYFDSYDVGEKLGTQIKERLDPFFSQNEVPHKKASDNFSTTTLYHMESSESTKSSFSPKLSLFAEPSPSVETIEYEFTLNKLPKMQKPKVIFCRVPGGLHYLDVRPPGKKIPHFYLQSLHYSGYVMETFKSGYFKIHLNNDLIVDGITCLSPAKYCIENFKNIYGLSSVVLNNVFLKYTTKKLDDFYEFFRSPWAFFLYHDQADELFAMVKELLPKGQRRGDTIQEALIKLDATIPDQPSPELCNMQMKLRNNFDASPHIEAITDYVIEWVSENEVLLPMYLQPSQRTQFYFDQERNQAFKKKKMSIINLISKII